MPRVLLYRLNITMTYFLYIITATIIVLNRIILRHPQCIPVTDIRQTGENKNNAGLLQDTHLHQRIIQRLMRAVTGNIRTI